MPPPVASTSGRPSREDALQHLALEAPVVGLAVQREDLGQRQARRLLDRAGRARRRARAGGGRGGAPTVVLPAPRRPSSAIDGHGAALAAAGRSSSAAGVVPSARASSRQLRTEMLPRPPRAGRGSARTARPSAPARAGSARAPRAQARARAGPRSGSRSRSAVHRATCTIHGCRHAIKHYIA